MLESWTGQTYKIPMFVSLSTTPRFLKVLQQAIIEIREKYGPNGLTVIFHEEKSYTQGQHYQILAEHLVRSKKYDPVNTWLLFSDDDDLWHEYRAELYHGYMLQVAGLSAEVLSVQALQYVEDCGSVVSVNCCRDVDEAILSGKLILSNPTQIDNYWANSVRLVTFRRFFQRAPAELLKKNLLGCLLCEIPAGSQQVQDLLFSGARWPDVVLFLAQ